MIKKILKWTAWISAVLALLFVIAYWTSPYWVPGQLARFLPPSIKLESLELERPGLTRTRVKQLTLHFDGPNKLAIELNNTELRYSLWQQQLLGVSAEKAIIKLSPSTAQTDDSSFQLPDNITIPQLPVNQLSIDNVELQGVAGQSFGLSDLEFNSQDQQLNLSSQISWMGLNFNLSSQVQHQNQTLQSLTLNLQQDDNHLELAASPLDGASWQLDLTGEIHRIPFIQIYSADLDTISFDLATNLQQIDEQHFIATLQQNSKLQLPLRFNGSWFEQEVASYAKQFGLIFDTKQLDKNLLLTVNTITDTQLAINSNAQQLTVDGQLDLTATNNNIKLNASLDELAFELDKTLTSLEQKASANLALDLTLPKTQFQTQDKGLNFNTQSVQANLMGSALFQNGSLRLQSSNLLFSLADSTIKANAYSVTLLKNQWQGTIDWTQPIAATLGNDGKAQKPQVPTQKLNLKSVKPLDVTVALTDESITAIGLSSELTLTNGQFKANYAAAELTLHNQPLKLREVKGGLSPDATNDAINGSLQFNQASYLSENIAVDYISGNFDWKLLKKSFTAKGSLKQSQNTIPVRYVYNLTNGAHDLLIDRSSLSMLTLKSWSPFLNAYPALQVTGGDLNIKKLQGDPLKLLFDGDISINDLSLLYDKLALNKATLSDKLSKKSSLQGAISAHVESIELAAGIAISDLKFTLEHTLEDYSFKDIKGSLLGGTVAIPRLDMHKTTIKPFTLHLSDINLQTLLTALESDKLSVSSKFDLILPLIIKPDSRQITNGTFISKQPGILKLKSDGGKQANIAFQALENFHYKELSGTIDYSSEGDYIITLYTLGSNPAVYNGFPIKLDLTLRGNLPNLLYSMLVTGDMATPVLDDLKQKELLKIQ